MKRKHDPPWNPITSPLFFNATRRAWPPQPHQTLTIFYTLRLPTVASAHPFSLLKSARSECGVVHWCAFGRLDDHPTTSLGRTPPVERSSTPAPPHACPPGCPTVSLPPTCIAAGALCSDAPHLYRHPLPTCIITGAQEGAPRSSTASPVPTAETHGPHTCGVRGNVAMAAE